MKYTLIIFMLLVLSSCRKEEYKPAKEEYHCSDNQKKLMDGFITAYLNKQIQLSKVQKAMMMPMLRQEAIKAFCIIKRD